VESQPALKKLIAQSEQMVQGYEEVTQKLDKLRGDLSIMESTAFTKVVMKGTANDLNARASVYWNPSTQEAYISIQYLKDISRENQFQLWAIVKGKTVDVGVFDKNFTGLLKMKNVEGATAFAVTIEPRGGKENPTMETMQVIGPLPLRDG
jgi:anti-sigma-K factor RskA